MPESYQFTVTQLTPGVRDDSVSLATFMGELQLAEEQLNRFKQQRQRAAPRVAAAAAGNDAPWNNGRGRGGGGGRGQWRGRGGGQGRGGGGGRGGRSRKNITCYRCGGRGHMEHECPSDPADAAANAVSVETAAVVPGATAQAKYAGGHDPTDYSLHEDLFHRLSDRYGPFDIDGAARADGSNAHVDEYCWREGRSFYKEYLAGRRVYCNPPWRAAGKFLRHYQEQSRLAPAATSGLFILPYRPDAKWWPLVQDMDMEEVERWEPGALLFTVPVPGGGRKPAGPCPHTVVAMYAPPGPAAAASAAAGTPRFIVDPGAGRHIVSSHSLLHEYRPPAIGDPATVVFGNGQRLPVVGVGGLILRSRLGSGTAQLHLTDVLHVPGSQPCLITPNVIARGRWEQDQRLGRLSVSGQLKLVCSLSGGQWEPQGMEVVWPREYAAATAAVEAAPAKVDEAEAAVLWHRRTGHAGYSTLLKAQAQVAGLHQVLPGSGR